MQMTETYFWGNLTDVSVEHHVLLLSSAYFLSRNIGQVTPKSAYFIT